MPFSPVTRQSLPDAVFDQLVTGIVDGDFEPGESLPSERRLAELLGVSRPAIREALKRLSQARLVAVRQGGNTTVQDFRRSAGIEMLPALIITSDGEVDVEVVRSIIELRGVLGPQLARFAADRAPDHVHELIAQTIERLEAAEGLHDQQVASLDFWDAVVTGADNLALRLLYNSLRHTYGDLLDAVAPMVEPEVSDVEGHRVLAQHLANHDAEAAAQAAERLLARGTDAALGLLARIAPKEA